MRPLRIEYSEALYHLTAKGNVRAPIFLDVGDRGEFLAILTHLVERYTWLCHSYCLMGNYYHLLIEPPDANLAAGMRQLGGMRLVQTSGHSMAPIIFWVRKCGQGARAREWNCSTTRFVEDLFVPQFHSLPSP